MVQVSTRINGINIHIGDEQLKTPSLVRQFVTGLNSYKDYNMQPKTIQDLLPLVEQPSRYLGTEINTIHKDHNQVKLKFLFAFPDLYEIGTSHFGIQILYHILNNEKEVVAERVFAPANDMAAHLKSTGIPLSALESGKSAREFDIIGFSLLYELNYTNILLMLDLAGIPLRSADRDDTHPIVIGGGPCTSNPEPVADFFDALVIGDGESVLLEMVHAWIDWRENGHPDRNILLESWSRITGVYIPSFYSATYNENGFQRLSRRTPTGDTPQTLTVTRAIVDDLDGAPFPDKPVVPFGRPVHDRLRLEVSRGCTRGCRFCQAGMIYRPVRERSMASLLNLSAVSLAATGYEDLSLLSLSTSDYGCIAPLLQRLVAQAQTDRVAVSFPSFRAGTMSAEMMALVKKVRKTGFTIAAEAGSQRLRDVINKNIQEQDIINTVRDAFQLGWQVIKLYFMVGLPTETREDLVAMVELVKELRKIPGPKGRKGKINVSVNTFIPKSHTPFQWSPQLSLAQSKEKIEWLRDRLKMPRVQFKWQKPETSFLEGIWARGDRRLCHLLEVAYRNGCRFDGWSDQFRYDRWLAAFDESAVDIDFYTTRPRQASEPLPWDHIDMRVDTAYLISEWKKSVTGESTPDCRHGDCQTCGVCDFKRIEPKVFSRDEKTTDDPPSGKRRESSGPFYRKLRLFYSKQGDARFFGHLELVNIFLRAIRRAGIPVKYSEGFHPLPKVSFDDPLPLGMASLEESFYIMVPGHISPGEVKDRINPQLTRGLTVFAVQLAPKKNKRAEVRCITYRITLADGAFESHRVAWFHEQPAVVLVKNKKGRAKRIDLKKAVQQINIGSPAQLDLVIRTEPGNNVRPADVLSEVFQLGEQPIKRALVIKSGVIDRINESDNPDPAHKRS